MIRGHQVAVDLIVRCLHRGAIAEVARPRGAHHAGHADDGIASYRTMFHEMGHSVYSASIDQPTLLLQDAASACFTEGIGQFFPMFLDKEG